MKVTQKLAWLSMLLIALGTFFGGLKLNMGSLLLLLGFGFTGMAIGIDLMEQKRST